MAWTDSDLDRIEAAIASGKLAVQFSDRSVTYRSITDLIKARDLIKNSLDTATDPTGQAPVRCTYATFSKG